MAETNEALYFDALKRIASYMRPEKLHDKAEKLYGVEGPEAIEMAYENVIEEAKRAIKGKRRPKPIVRAAASIEGGKG